MDKREKTLKHLKEFRALVEEKVNTEKMFREHLKRKKPVDLDVFIADSVSYQRFLEQMITNVIDEIIKDITL